MLRGALLCAGVLSVSVVACTEDARLCPDGTVLVRNPKKNCEFPLCAGDVCKSGGVETGPGVSRQDDCREGTICSGLPGVVAIGGEVTRYCLVPCKPGSKTCNKGETCKALNDREGVCVEGAEPVVCTADVKKCPDGTFVGRDSNNNCAFFPCPLQLHDICKSGGVETGPGVSRQDDCPRGTVCAPASRFAIGGEVTYRCQTACSARGRCPEWRQYCHTSSGICQYNCFTRERWTREKRAWCCLFRPFTC